MTRLPDPYTREATVVRAVCRVLDAHGAVHWNQNGLNGETGIPDRIAFYKGHALALECKRPKGGRVSPKQRWMLDRLAAQGVVALVVTDAEQVRAALCRIDEEERMKNAEARPEEQA